MAINKTTIDEFVTRIKNNTPLVYEKGKTEGAEEGYDQGLTDVIEKQEEFLNGEPKTHYDLLWDAFQENGNRRNYRNTFCTWKPEYYKPKYPIIAEGNAAAAFWGAKVEEIGVLDFTEVTRIDTAFYQCFNLKTIEKLIVSEKCTNYVSCFTSCNVLENITIEGTIAADITFQYSKKLNRASIESIINALSDKEEGLTVTFPKIAINNAFTTEEWEALEATKPKWNISLLG